MADLLGILSDYGVTVTPVDGWQTRRRPGTFAPCGIIFHHTAGDNDLSVVVNGRRDLPGPLANFYSDNDAHQHFQVNVVAAGRANHAGRGSQAVLDRVRKDLPPLGDARQFGYLDGPNGNDFFYGIEAEDLGDPSTPWPQQQLHQIALTCAALCRHHGWSANRVIAHREWTRRKPDPAGLDMNAFRSYVAALMNPNNSEEEDMAKIVPMVRRDGTVGPERFLDDGIHIRWIASTYELEELLAQGHREYSRPVHETHVRERRVFVGPKPQSLA